MSSNGSMYEPDSDDDLPTLKRKGLSDKIDVVVIERWEGVDADDQVARLVVRLVVSVESESNFYIGFTEDLSDAGVFVATHAPRNVGSIVDLVIALPDRTIRAEGTVRWLRPYSEANQTVPGMGIRFDRLSPGDADRIREFAKSRQPMFFDDESVEDARVA